MIERVRSDNVAERAAVAEANPAVSKLARPASVAGNKFLWRYAITLAAMHVLAGLAFVPALFVPASVAICVIGVFLFGQGINLGYHRLLAHRSLVVPRWLEQSFVVLALCSLQDTPMRWVAAHRHHHKHSDERDDPHTPRAGFIWSHFGWLFYRNSATRGAIAYQVYARDLRDYPFYRALERHWWLGIAIYAAHAVMFALVGFAFGLAIGDDWSGAVQLSVSVLVWGVFLRTVLVWHITWSINSVTHCFGYRTYSTGENSRNNWLLGYLASGEGWHNNHHHDSASASNQHRWWEVDFTYYVICLLERLGLATEVIRPRAKRQRAAKSG